MVAEMLEIRKRSEPATPLALPSSFWFLTVSVTRVMDKLSAQPMQKTPKETSVAASARVSGVHVATPMWCK
jgi:hypothetical protein